MSPSTPEHDWLAAEHALGLLGGADLAEARRRTRQDPAFAADVRRWSERFAPLLDEIAEAPPPPQLWTQIDRALGRPAAANDNGGGLQRRVRFWRNWSVGATALAAALGLLLLLDPRTTPPPASPPPAAPPPVATPEPQAPLIAAMTAKDSSARLVATWQPEGRSLTVAAAGDLPRAAAHQLWMINADGGPRSLGLLPASGRLHARLAAEVAAAVGRGTVLALSEEPAGGSPTGQPTGAVIASGPLLPA